MMIAVFLAGSAAHIQAMIQADLRGRTAPLQLPQQADHLRDGAVSQDASTESFEYIAQDNQVQPTGLVGDHHIQLIQTQSMRPHTPAVPVPRPPLLDGIERPPRFIS
ncbi:hypothetical protein SAMN05444747_1248 [Variovorax sp. OV329]|nr:hypothetical protein SAMN05444747_1248 [Variovorax sp. OV329]